MKKRQKFTIAVLALLLTLLFIPAPNSLAASKKSKALKSYRQLLSGSTIAWGDSTWQVSLKNCSFAIAYIDKDAVPELILYNTTDTFHASGYGMVYTYRDGKAVYAGTLSMNGKFYYYKKKGILIDSYTGSGVGVFSYCQLSDETLTTRLTKNVEYSVAGKASRQTYYDASDSQNFKQLSKAKFNRLLKKLVGRTKKSGVTFRSNTKANRKKYLK